MSTELVSPGEAARMLKVDRITIYRWIKAGRLQAERLPGGRLRIDAEQVKKLLTRVKG